MMLFNCCSEEMTAVPSFFVFPWDGGQFSTPTTRSVLKSPRALGLIEANRHARFSLSKQSLKYSASNVTFIWFNKDVPQ